MKQQAAPSELFALLRAVQTSDFKTTEQRLSQLSPEGALEALVEVLHTLNAQGEHRRRHFWMAWLALTLVLTASCSACLNPSDHPDASSILVGFMLSTAMAGAVLLFLSLFARPNFHHTLHYLRASILRADSALCVRPLLRAASAPRTQELQAILWRKLTELLPRLTESAIVALTPLEQDLLAAQSERHGTALTIGVLQVFTSLQDARLKPQAERWLRSSDERLKEAAEDYLKAIE